MSATRSRLCWACVCCLFAVGASAFPALGTQAPATVTYTPGQALAGQQEFARRCAECHLSQPDGSRRAPALSGAAFRSRWVDRRVRDLFVRMRDGMPPIGVRPRGEGYANILAFLLQENGQNAGARPLDPLSYDRLPW
jgi:mono/diheme cytochrome c family protein